MDIFNRQAINFLKKSSAKNCAFARQYIFPGRSASHNLGKVILFEPHIKMSKVSRWFINGIF